MALIIIVINVNFVISALVEETFITINHFTVTVMLLVKQKFS